MSVKQNSRISILKEEGLFSLIIYPEREKWKVNLLFFWLVCWSVCGIIFISSYVTITNRASAGRDNYNVYFNTPESKFRENNYQKQTVLKETLEKISTFDRQRVVLLVVLCFWLYYEYRVSRAYLYRRRGHEKLWIKNGVLYFRKEITKRSKTRAYEIDFVKDFRLANTNKNDVFQSMSRSFWTMGGDSIAFDYHSKVVGFGIQLSDEDAKHVLHEMTKAHKRALAKKENEA